MNLRQNRWLIPVVLWFFVTLVLVLIWRACWNPAVVQNLPHWFLRIASLTGSVLYEDPGLAVRIQLSRLMVIATAAVGVWIAVLEKPRLVNAIRSLICQESDPLNLAIFRIVVFWQIYQICDFDFIIRIASLPTGLQYPPQSGIPPVGFLAHFAHWPLHTISPAVLGPSGVVMKYAALTAAFGLFSRTSAAVVSLIFLIFWSRLQWYGKVDHLHHLLWFALLLAVSPSGDALSVDRIIARARGYRTPAPGRQYGAPLAFAMILMGVVYFFPGLWKICRSGLDWSLSDSPRLMMQEQWRLYGDWLPAFRYDQHPWLYHVGALGVQLFELSFLFLLLGRWTRLLAGVMGLSFHLMTSVTLNIGFESLRDCYVVFVDWASVLRKLYRTRLPIAAPTAAIHPLRGTVTIGALLVAGNLWAGAIRAMDGWPFACYPPFDGLSQPFYRTLRMDVTMSDGATRVIVPDEYRTIFRNRWNNLLQRILDTRDEDDRRARLRLVWTTLARTDPVIGSAHHVRFYSVRSFVDPSHWSKEPDDPQFLYEADLVP